MLKFEKEGIGGDNRGDNLTIMMVGWWLETALQVIGGDG